MFFLGVPFLMLNRIVVYVIDVFVASVSATARLIVQICILQFSNLMEI